jgi:hypothetical protein
MPLRLGKESKVLLHERFMSQASNSGSCGYAQAMADQGPKYDNQVRKGKKKRCDCQGKGCKKCRRS